MSFLLMLAVAAIGAPLFLPVSAHVSRVGTLMWLALIVASGLHLVTGLTRVITLCHFGLVGVGAYSAAILSIRLDSPPIMSIAVGACVSGAVAAVLCAATYRLADHYLTLATLAANELLANVFRGFTSLTGGANGLGEVPPISLFGFAFDRPSLQYPIAATVALGVFALLWLLNRHWFGHALRASGQLGSRTASLGVSEASLRSAGFVLSAVLAGLAGGLAAHIDGFVGPENFGVGAAVLYLCFMVVAGLGHLRSVAVTAIGVVVIAEWLRELHSWQMVVLGILTLTAMLIRTIAQPDTSRRGAAS